MPLQGSMSVERMCQLAQVSRAGFYRSLQERTPVEEDMDCDRPSSKSCCNIDAATVTAGLRRSCGGEACWPITSAWPES